MKTKIGNEKNPVISKILTRKTGIRIYIRGKDKPLFVTNTLIEELDKNTIELSGIRATSTKLFNHILDFGKVK